MFTVVDHNGLPVSVAVASISDLQGGAAMTDTAGAIYQEMIATLVVIHRVASRALSEEERVGQRILGDPRAEIRGLLVQMMAIEKIARAGLPEEGRELLEIATAKEETAALRAEGRKTH
jgi:hypothetical protein